VSRISPATPRLLRFLQFEASGGIALAAAALVAVVLANSPLAGAYHGWLETRHTLQIGLFEHTTSLAKWVKDGLMALFFFHVGLEIKREVVRGELSDPRRLALPVLAALGGMLVPAGVYLAIWGAAGADPMLMSGWAIPVATDIAFAVAAVSLVARRVPLGLKVFLLTLAVVDDLGAVVLVALLYTEAVNHAALAGALAVVLGLIGLNRLGVARPVVYVAGTVICWALMLKSGFHPTLAGVLCALTVPLAAPDSASAGALDDLHDDFDPWVKFAIMPLFALTHAGFSFSGIGPQTLASPLTAGIALGLCLGKPVGVVAASWLAWKAGLARLPRGAGWAQIWGVGALCGIGFTMSLFLGGLAFDRLGPDYATDVRVGVFAGSLLAALIGLSVLALSAPPARSASGSGPPLAQG
jgi:Na+:H+ antiporter, NhaA family